MLLHAVRLYPPSTPRLYSGQPSRACLRQTAPPAGPRTWCWRDRAQPPLPLALSLLQQLRVRRLRPPRLLVWRLQAQRLRAQQLWMRRLRAPLPACPSACPSACAGPSPVPFICAARAAWYIATHSGIEATGRAVCIVRAMMLRDGADHRGGDAGSYVKIGVCPPKAILLPAPDVCAPCRAPQCEP